MRVVDGKIYVNCKGCGKELELNKENFEPHSNTKSGFLGTCRVCRRAAKNEKKKRKVKRAKKKEERPKIKSEEKSETNIEVNETSTVEEPVIETQQESIEIAKENIIEVVEEQEPKFKLDLSKIVSEEYPELYEELKGQAEDRMRPIEYHALWLMKVAMDAEILGRCPYGQLKQ